MKRTSEHPQYLETINRKILDFDFEKLCSISLSTLNIYCCLVCGKYLQGRGTSSHAYFHSMHEDHHVFINLSTMHTYILPEAHRVTDTALDDIKYVLNPTYSTAQLHNSDVAMDLLGKPYIPGYIGLNNIKNNDFINVVMNALNQVVSLRQYFLLDTAKQLDGASELVNRFGMLVRKMWNANAFRGHVSPHEFIQQVSIDSKKRFTLGVQSDPIQYMTWLLNTLHSGLTSGVANGTSIITETFQGQIYCDTQEIVVSHEQIGVEFDTLRPYTTKQINFLFLSLDLPSKPLFTGESDDIIPQTPLKSLLAKYMGETVTVDGKLRRFRIKKLPGYLIFCIKRFDSSQKKQKGVQQEKNTIIVNHPISNLSLSGISRANADECSGDCQYDLVANVYHEGNGSGEAKGSYRVHVRSKECWYQMQDLFVEQIQAQMVILSESVIQIWKRL